RSRPQGSFVLSCLPSILLLVVAPPLPLPGIAEGRLLFVGRVTRGCRRSTEANQETGAAPGPPGEMHDVRPCTSPAGPSPLPSVPFRVHDCTNAERCDRDCSDGRH